MRPVAYRRGWVAEAEVPAELRVAFQPQPDGSWQLVVPLPPGADFAQDLHLDYSDDEVRIACPGASRVVRWPPGASPEQIAACSAKLLKRRGELRLTLPPAQGSQASFAAAQPSQEETASAAVSSSAPSEGACAKPASQVSTARALPASPMEAPAAPVAPTALTAPSQGRGVADAAVGTDEADAGSQASGRCAGQTSGEAMSQKVDTFRQNLRSNPTAGLAIGKDGRTTQAVDIDPKAMDIAATLMLHSAAANGNAELIKRLLDARAQPDAQDELGATALEKACLAGSEPAVTTLLDSRANIQGWPSNPSTPLHRAAVIGGQAGAQIIGLLLERRADPRAMDHFGRTPADAMRFTGAPVLPELLLARGSRGA